MTGQCSGLPTAATPFSGLTTFYNGGDFELVQQPEDPGNIWTGASQENGLSNCRYKGLSNQLDY